MAYSRYLIRQAIARNATILVMRKEKALLDAVPELSGYPYLRANSPMSGYVSQGNVPEFERLVHAALQEQGGHEVL